MGTSRDGMSGTTTGDHVPMGVDQFVYHHSNASMAHNDVNCAINTNRLSPSD